MSEKRTRLPSHDRRLWPFGAGAVVGSLALTAVVLMVPAGYNAADELPHREIVGNTEVTYSEYGVRILTDLAAPEGTPPVTSYCRGDELLIIRRLPPPGGMSPWQQLEAFEAGAEVLPGHPNCYDGLLMPSEYPNPLAVG